MLLRCGCFVFVASYGYCVDWLLFSVSLIWFLVHHGGVFMLILCVVSYLRSHSYFS